MHPQAEESCGSVMHELELRAIGLVGTLYWPVGMPGIDCPLGSGVASIQEVTVTVAAAVCL